MAVAKVVAPKHNAYALTHGMTTGSAKHFKRQIRQQPKESQALLKQLHL